MNPVKAKTILSARSSNIGFNGAEFNMNLYRGCSHGCIYCDSRSSCYQVFDFDRVRSKENALAILDRELSKKRMKGVIAFGAMSDSYNPLEKKLKLTKGALKIIKKHHFGVSMLTKSSLISRDMELFHEINRFAPTAVRMTITTFDDELCSIIEPNVNVSSERFSTLQEFSKNGIVTGIHLWPILAFINDDIRNIKDIVGMAADSGVNYVYPYFGVTLRHNQRQYFFDRLDEFFPGLKQEYKKTFGDSYECISPNIKVLEHVFISECEKNHLLYKVPDVIKLIRNSGKSQQISFFK